MSLQERNKETVRRFNQGFIEGGDVDLFKATVSPDFVNHSAQEGMPADADGAFYFFTQVLRPAFADLTVIIHDQIAEGDKVVTRKSYEGTHSGPFLGVPATGRSVRFDVTDIIALQDDLYLEHWQVDDLLGLMQQLTVPIG